MARKISRWCGPELKRFRIAALSGAYSVAELAAEYQRSRKVIRAKLAEEGIKLADEILGKERRCSNWDSWERPCHNTFVGKYAGPCPRCAGVASATPFELPVALRA